MALLTRRFCIYKFSIMTGSANWVNSLYQVDFPPKSYLINVLDSTLTTCEVIADRRELLFSSVLVVKFASNFYADEFWSDIHAFPFKYCLIVFFVALQLCVNADEWFTRIEPFHTIRSVQKNLFLQVRLLQLFQLFVDFDRYLITDAATAMRASQSITKPLWRFHGVSYPR